ncbi:MAG TPA: hypothetical protein PKI60_07260 [Oscillospiraceae bacterium]|nr:hypothetical protein [Oscillospiraceae bacterium]
MTAKNLSRIPKLRIEIDILSEQLSYETLGDTVKGSDTHDPYVLRTVKISGMSKKGMALSRQIKQKEVELIELSAYIIGIEDSWIRTMFFLKFDRGMKYKQVALKMGTTEAAVIMTISRYLSKNKSC